MVLTYDYNKSLGYLTGLASRLLSNTLAARFKAADIDMTAEQWGAIVVLLNGDGMTQGQLGEQLCLNGHPGFESLPLRHEKQNKKPKRIPETL